MSVDIVERLRLVECFSPAERVGHTRIIELCLGAADEIERLRAERDLFHRFFTENRASLSQINSAGDVRVSFLGPQEIPAECVADFRRALED